MIWMYPLGMNAFLYIICLYDMNVSNAAQYEYAAQYVNFQSQLEQSWRE